jgi:hypothetical protein
MKLVLFVLFMLFFKPVFAQNCNIGNKDSVGFNNHDNVILKNYLLGVKFNLLENGQLHSLNLIGRNTGAKVQLSIYEDINGVPGNLIISTDTATVGTGVISISVSPTRLLAGNYWIMAIYNASDSHTYVMDTIGLPVYFQQVPFGDPLPQNGSSFSSFTGRDFTYFAEIVCESLSISDLYENANIRYYPNPVSDFFTINVYDRMIGSAYCVVDQLGKQVLTGKLSNEASLIDIGQLPTGIYFLLVGNDKTHVIKLIKI